MPDKFNPLSIFASVAGSMTGWLFVITTLAYLGMCLGGFSFDIYLLFFAMFLLCFFHLPATVAVLVLLLCWYLPIHFESNILAIACALATFLTWWIVSAYFLGF
jgi:hypothetical protein